MAESLQYAGEYHLNEMSIMAPSGNFESLEQNVLNFNIYEDIFVGALYGDITIIDVDSMSETLPIIGQEQLILNVTTPGLEIAPIIHNFSVYTIERREDISKGGQVLKLSFCSPEVLRNERIRVSKSYTNTIDNIVADVLANEIKTKKTFRTEPTSGIRKIVSPNFHPYSLINSLTQESVSQKFGANHFLFYESLRAINFISLEHLYTLPSVGEIESDGADSVGGPLESNVKPDPIVEFKRPLEFQVNTTNHLISNIRNGLLGSKMTTYNIFRKNYEKYDFGYFNEFYRLPRTNTSKRDGTFGASFAAYSNGYYDSDQKNIGEYPDSKIHLNSISSSRLAGNRWDTTHSVDLFAGTDGAYPYVANGNSNILSRNSKLAELINGISITMKVHGHTMMGVGDKLTVKFPAAKISQDRQQDRYLSGDFLITKTRHIFNNETRRYQIVIVAASDDLRAPLPDSTSATKSFTDDFAGLTGARRVQVGQ